MKKLKKADKNLKEFFMHLKREIIDKADDELILPDSFHRVKEAKSELEKRLFIRYLY